MLVENTSTSKVKMHQFATCWALWSSLLVWLGWRFAIASLNLFQSTAGTAPKSWARWGRSCRWASVSLLQKEHWHVAGDPKKKYPGGPQFASFLFLLPIVSLKGAHNHVFVIIIPLCRCRYIYGYLRTSSLSLQHSKRYGWTSPKVLAHSHININTYVVHIYLYIYSIYTDTLHSIHSR